MSRFSVAAIINWSDHYSTECSPYSWKLFWHNWFTLTSAYLFIATVSPGQQSERWEVRHALSHVSLFHRNAQTLKCVWVTGNCSGTVWAASLSIRVQLVRNTPGRTHLRAAAASAAAVGHKQGQGSTALGEFSNSWNSAVTEAPRLLSPKLFFPY